MKKALTLFVSDEAPKPGGMCLWERSLDRSALSVCGLSVALSMAYILDLDTHATMTPKASHNILISAYRSTALQSDATLQPTRLCVSACLFRPLDIMLSALPPNDCAPSRDEHVMSTCSLHFASRRSWNARRYAASV